MIRGRPSISTIGIAGEETSRKNGSSPASRAARIWATRSWSRTFAKTSVMVSPI